MRLGIHRQVIMLKHVNDAQRHHYLHTTLWASANVVTRATLLCLLRSGLLLHYTPRTLPSRRAASPFAVILRY